MALRYYSNTAVATTLAAPISGSDTSMVVTTASGLPGSFPYTMIVDYGASTQEVVEVSAAAGTTLTISRGVDNTSAQAHGLAAVVVHGITKRDVSEPNSHIAATTNEHGLSGGAAVVGTTQAQTLTNKTMSGASNTFTALPAANVTGNLSGVSSVTSSGAISGTTITGSGAVSGTTITGSSTVTGTALIPTGLTGATTASRYVGGTATVAPTTGTFNTGDFEVVATGKIFVCTTGGTPGTWTNVGSLYLPLAGGTLSGGLTGTTGVFSSSMAADSLAATNAITGRNATLTGASDIVQLSVKGNATQTSNLVEFKDSTNALVASVTNTALINHGANGVPFVEWSKSANQSLANSTTTQITWDTADSNRRSFGSPGGTITIPAGYGGVYTITVFGRFAANATGFRLLLLDIDGVTPVHMRVPAVVTAAQPTDLVITCTQLLTAGQVIQAQAFQNSGGALNLEFSAAVKSRIQLVRLGN